MINQNKMYKIVFINLLILGLLFNSLMGQEYIPGASTVYVCDLEKGALIGGEGPDNYCYNWTPENDDIDNPNIRNPRITPSVYSQEYHLIVMDNLEIIAEEDVTVIQAPSGLINDIRIDDATCCIGNGISYNHINLNITTDPISMINNLEFFPASSPDMSLYIGSEGILIDTVTVKAVCPSETDGEKIQKEIVLNVVLEGYKKKYELSSKLKDMIKMAQGLFNTGQKVISPAEELLPCKWADPDIKIKYTQAYSPKCCYPTEPWCDTTHTIDKSVSGYVDFGGACDIPLAVTPMATLANYVASIKLTLGAYLRVSATVNKHINPCAGMAPDFCFTLLTQFRVPVGLKFDLLDGKALEVKGTAIPIMGLPQFKYCIPDTGENGFNGAVTFTLEGKFEVKLWNFVTFSFSQVIIPKRELFVILEDDEN